jgi:hypothetical protein
VARQLRQQVLGLEHAGGGAAEDEVHRRARRLDARLGQRLARGDDAHGVGAGPSLGLAGRRHLGGGEPGHLGSDGHVGGADTAAPGELEERQRTDGATARDQAVHGGGGAAGERRDDADAGHPDAHRRSVVRRPWP